MPASCANILLFRKILHIFHNTIGTQKGGVFIQYISCNSAKYKILKY